MSILNETNIASILNAVRAQDIPINEENVRCLLINKTVTVLLPSTKTAIRFANITIDANGEIEININRAERVA